MSLNARTVAHLVDAMLAEDVGRGDVTSQALIPADARFAGVARARQPLVVAGMDVALAVFERLAPEADLAPTVADGDKVAAGTVLLRLQGPARALLTAERSALNVLQHLSGIATLTRAFVERIEDTGCRLLDTRKTIPGLRAAAKYATLMGGAKNHRMRLDDGVLIKDNHIAVCGSVAAAVQRARDAGVGPIEVECDTLDQVDEAVAAGADIVLLDNMDPDRLREAVRRIGGRARAEASGGVSLETVRAIAETGVDYVSVGRITQSAPAVDIGLDWHAED